MSIENENKLFINKNCFLYNDDLINREFISEINYIKENFCGKIITEITDINSMDLDRMIVYIYGDIEDIFSKIKIHDRKEFYVIQNLSYNYEKIIENISLISFGEIPINVNNVGVFFRKLFNDDKYYFNSLSEQHQFQSLTESNKPGESYRKGIYITNVEEINNEFTFNLLRCSTNLDGPTDNFRSIDNEIIDKVNNISQYFFEQKTNLNHVLAQIYNNNIYNGKEKKAKIKSHSDKTKDMPRNALIAFCTFYQFNEINLKEIKNPKNDSYDLHYKNASILTRLHFKLKKNVDNNDLVKKFDVILYPNSVFVISLETNRLYTHEIVPSHLPINKLPTRLGYVIRCSKTKAIFKNSQTYVKYDQHIKLEEPSEKDITELKNNYFKENCFDKIVNYEKIYFSLNQGDYMKPNI